MVQIQIEGLIGAGKSTFINWVKTSFPNQVMVFEEVALSSKLLDCLQDFYNDPPTHAFNLQSRIIRSMRDDMLRYQDKIMEFSSSPDKLLIWDRSLHSVEFIFIPVMMDHGWITPLQANILYQQIRSSWSILFNPNFHLDALIWFDTSTATAMERIKIRARPGEEQISLEYLSNILFHGSKWFFTSSQAQAHIWINGQWSFPVILAHILQPLQWNIDVLNPVAHEVMQSFSLVSAKSIYVREYDNLPRDRLPRSLLAAITNDSYIRPV